MCAAVYRQRHVVRATKVNAGLAESNGRLLLGIWRDSLHFTCWLTACTPGSAPGPTLGNEYGKNLPFLRVIATTRRRLKVSVISQGQRLEYVVSKHGNAVGLTSILDLGQFVL